MEWCNLVQNMFVYMGTIYTCLSWSSAENNFVLELGQVAEKQKLCVGVSIRLCSQELIYLFAYLSVRKIYKEKKR